MTNKRLESAEKALLAIMEDDDEVFYSLSRKIRKKLNNWSYYWLADKAKKFMSDVGEE